MAAAEGGGDEAEAEAALRNAADEDEAWGERGMSGSAAESAGEEEEEAALETAREGGGRGRGRGRAAGTRSKRRTKKGGAAASRYSYGTKHSHLIASVMRRMNQFGACAVKENPMPSDAESQLSKRRTARGFSSAEAP